MLEFIPMLHQQMEQIPRNTGAWEMVFEAFDREKVKGANSVALFLLQGVPL